MEDREFKPDWYSPTGHTISTVLKDRGISEEEFAAMIEQTPEFTHGLLEGEEHITEDMAGRLEKTLGSTKKFWLKRDATYWKDKERLTGK
jgi:HTH-type transcriptional regulator/antitoxin HigA